MSINYLKDKMLIIGGSGLVGDTLIQYALKDYKIFATYNKNKIKSKHVSSIKIDLLQNDNSIKNLINTIKPNVVVNAIAFGVDFCEINPQLANLLHIEKIKEILSACKTSNCKLIYFSTDAVFDGKSNKKYVENDTCNPINYYGKTKLIAENLVMMSSEKNVILRTAVIYGWHKNSRFTNWIIESLKENKTVDPFTDQSNTPTLVDDLAKVILKIIKYNVSGIYHATGKTCISRFEMTKIIAKTFGFNENLIIPVTHAEKKQNAPRPEKTCLDSTKLEKLIQYEFSDINTGIDYILKKSIDFSK